MPDPINVLTKRDVELLKGLARSYYNRPVNTPERSVYPVDSVQTDVNATPELYFVLTPDGGIPGATPGESGGDPPVFVPAVDCQVYRTDGDDGQPVIVSGLVKRVYNLSTEDVPANIWVRITKDKFGYWFCDPTFSSSVTSRPAPARLHTREALPANTYNNGASGVGATLTGNSNGTIANVDDIAPATDDRLVIANEVDEEVNGVYKVTQLGDGSHPYILTRTEDYDSPGELLGALIAVMEGRHHKDTLWLNGADAPISVGSTPIQWEKVGPTGFPVELTSVWDATTGYSWKRLESSGVLWVDASPSVTGENASTLDDDEDLEEGDRGWLEPEPVPSSKYFIFSPLPVLSTIGCGLKFDVDGKVEVDVTSLVGEGLFVESGLGTGSPTCHVLSVRVECGLAIDESANAVTLNLTEVATDGLYWNAEECALGINVGCSLALTDGFLGVDLVSLLDATGEIGAGLLIVPGSPCPHIEAYIGCGLFFDADNKIAIDVDSLVGSGLEKFSFSEECDRVQVKIGCHLFYDGETAVAVNPYTLIDAPLDTGLGAGLVIVPAEEPACSHIEASIGCGLFFGIDNKIEVDVDQLVGDRTVTGLIVAEVERTGTGSNAPCPTLSFDGVTDPTKTTTETLVNDISLSLINEGKTIRLTKTKTTYNNFFNEANVLVFRNNGVPVTTTQDVSPVACPQAGWYCALLGTGSGSGTGYDECEVVYLSADEVCSVEICSGPYDSFDDADDACGDGTGTGTGTGSGSGTGTGCTGTEYSITGDGIPDAFVTGTTGAGPWSGDDWTMRITITDSQYEASFDFGGGPENYFNTGVWDGTGCRTLFHLTGFIGPATITVCCIG